MQQQWTMTYDLDLRTWPRKDQHKPPCWISRSSAISFKSYFPDTLIKHTHQMRCSVGTTELIKNGPCLWLFMCVPTNLGINCVIQCITVSVRKIRRGLVTPARWRGITCTTGYVNDVIGPAPIIVLQIGVAQQQGKTKSAGSLAACSWTK